MLHGEKEGAKSISPKELQQQMRAAVQGHNTPKIWQTKHPKAEFNTFKFSLLCLKPKFVLTDLTSQSRHKDF